MKPVPRGNHASSGWRLIRSAAVFGVALSLAVTGCGSGESTEPGANNTVKTGEAPDYYPAEYRDVIAASKNEGGTHDDLLQYRPGELGPHLPGLQEEVSVGRRDLGEQSRQR